MRIFRIKHRWISNIDGKKINKVIKSRDYLGIENIKKYGIETYNRYNSIKYNGLNVGEIYERLDNKWIKLNDKEINVLF